MQGIGIETGFGLWRAQGRAPRWASRAVGAAVSAEPAPESFEARFREHEADVLRLCRRLLGHEAARDASHEVFLRGRRGFDGWDPERPFRTWLLAVASHYCVDQLRRRSRETRIFDASDLSGDDLAGPGPSPLRAALAAETRAEVLAALDALPRKYRVPLVLRYYEELDYDAIGDVLDVGRGQVGSLLFRAKRQLREILARGGAP